jgi:hypothetical protein
MHQAMEMRVLSGELAKVAAHIYEHVPGLVLHPRLAPEQFPARLRWEDALEASFGIVYSW